MRGRLGWLALGVVALDQATKWWMLRALVFGESVPVIPGVFHLTLVRNTGVAFGWFAGQGGVVLGVTVTLILLLLLTLRSRSGSAHPPVPWSMGLILGGALGNLLDRVRFGAVIDFLDFRVWPVFNAADSCITIGAVLVAWAWWRQR